MTKSRHNVIIIVIVTAFCVTAQVAAQTFLRSGTMLNNAREALTAGKTDRAVELADSVLHFSANSALRIEAVDILSRAYVESGRPNLAYDAFQEGLKIMDELTNNTDITFDERNLNYKNFHFNYARFLLSIGQFDQCLKYLDNIIFPCLSEEWMRVEGLKTSAYTHISQFDKAIQIYDSIINRVDCDRNPKSNLTLNTLVNNRGFLHLSMGHYDRALQDFTSAMRNLPATEKRQLEVYRGNRALALSGSNRHDEAINEIDSALANILTITDDDDEDYIILLRKKGEVLTKAGFAEDGVEAFKSYFQKEKEHLLRLLPTMSRNTRLQYWTMMKPLLSKCFLTQDTDPGFLFEVALTRREISLIGNYDSEETSSRLDFNSSELRKSLSEDEAAVCFVTYENQPGQIQYAALTMDNEGAYNFINLFNQDFINLPYSGSYTVYDCIISEDPMAKDKLYSDQELGNKVWGKITTALPENIKKIHFIAEGMIHLWGIENMPFEGKDKYKLVRHFSLFDIGKSQSHDFDGKGAILFIGGLNYDEKPDSLASAPTPQNFNNEAFKELTRGRSAKERLFNYLPGTKEEILRASAHMPASEVAQSMTEEQFKSESGSYRNIHVATHGYALDCGIFNNSENTFDWEQYDLSLLRCGIALTGANIRGRDLWLEDGILSAREICDIDLSKVDMVVLSACQTAKGQIFDENASGLVRALKTAGVNTIVATLWEVDDKSTVLFMNYFYQCLGAGDDKYTAFERAKELTASHTVMLPERKFNPAKLAGDISDECSGHTPYGNPWYWAPFIIIDP